MTICTHPCVLIVAFGLAPVVVPDLDDNGILEQGQCHKDGADEQPEINEGECVCNGRVFPCRAGNVDQH